MLTKLLKRLTSADIQWVVEWWRIEAMTICGFKENFIPLIRFFHCFYYPTFCIVRQFDDRQGVPCGIGSYHTLAFTERFLARVKETWP